MSAFDPKRTHALQQKARVYWITLSEVSSNDEDVLNTDALESIDQKLCHCLRHIDLLYASYAAMK
jgi:hypothetical protein